MANVSQSIFATFGIKENVGQDFRAIADKIQQQSPLVEKALSDPIVKTEKYVSQLEKSIVKMMGTAERRIFSDRDVETIEKLSRALTQVQQQLSTMPNSLPASALASRVGQAQLGIGYAQALGQITHPFLSTNPGRFMGQAGPGAPNITPIRFGVADNSHLVRTEMIHGPGVPSGFRTPFQQIQDYERMGMATRPAFVREDEATRQARIQRRLAIQNGTYGESFGRLLDERDSMTARNRAFNSMADKYNINPYSSSGDRPRGILGPAAQEEMQRQYQQRLMAADEATRGRRITGSELAPYRPGLHQVPIRVDELGNASFDRDQYASASKSIHQGGLAQGIYATQDRQAYNQESKKIIETHRSERQSVDDLRAAYMRLSTEELKRAHGEAQAMNQAGRPGYRLAMSAMEQEAARRGVDVRTGVGSSSHSFRYGTQNAAFALEDYLISSQYGGPKAGFRAITNNLTAIAAASTMSMNPMASAGIIAGTAVLGAAAPLAYDYMTKGSAYDEELIRKENQLSKMSVSNRDAMMGNRLDILRSGEDVGRHQGGLNAKNDQLIELMNREQDRARRFSGVQKAHQRSIQNKNDGWFGSAVESMAVHSGAWLGFEGARKVAAEWEEEAHATREIDRLKLEEEGDVGKKELLHSQMAERQKALEHAKGTRQMHENLGRSFRQSQLPLYARQLKGEIIDPREMFKLQMNDLAEQRRIVMDRESDPSQRADKLRAIDNAELDTRQQFQRDRLRYKEEIKQHGLDFEQSMIKYERDPKKALQRQNDLNKQIIAGRGDLSEEQRGRLMTAQTEEFGRNLTRLNEDMKLNLNKFETNPVKRINNQFDVEQARLERMEGITPEQRAAALKGLAKQRKLALEQSGDTPALGNAIDVGSTTDVALRQKYFNRNPGIETTPMAFGGAESKLGEIVKEIIKLRDAILNKKPQVAKIK